MKAYSAEALILRTYRYGEADRIVVFLTEDRGKKRGVAKNATKSRRRFGAALEPMTSGRVAYVEREQRELVRLDRVELLATPLRTKAGRSTGVAAHALSHAGYFAELLDEWAPDGMANQRLYRLGLAVGEALGGAESVEALARYFEYWLLRLEGVYPGLGLCPRCGKRPLTDGALLVMADRSYVCEDCADNGLHLSPDAVGFLRHTCRQKPDRVAAGKTSMTALREIERVHDRLIASHLEKELRSARVVRELRPEL